MTNSKLLLTLSKRLSEDELEILISWIVEGIKNIGIEHNDQCLSVRPHSHSCDCDCGVDEINDKVLKILDVNNG